MFAKFAEALRGARRVEIMAALAFMAALAMAVMSAGDGDTELEKRLERALEAVKGAGEVQVMITTDSDGAVIGVLVVADGAEDISVRLDILHAVRTLMGVDSKQVEIARMRGNKR